MKNKVYGKFLTLVIIFTLLLIILSSPALADQGNINVEVVVNSFDSKPLAGIEVTYFNKMMTTSRRGNCVFKVLGLAEHETEFLQVNDSNQTHYGVITTNLILSSSTGADIRPDGNPGSFVMDLHYTLNTDAVIIITEISQAGNLEIVAVDFDQVRGSDHLESEPEPEHQDQPEHPPEPEPDHEEFDQDQSDPQEPDSQYYEPDSSILDFSPLVIGLVAAVFVLFIIVIVLLAKNLKNNKQSK